MRRRSDRPGDESEHTRTKDSAVFLLTLIEPYSSDLDTPYCRLWRDHH